MGHARDEEREQEEVEQPADLVQTEQEAPSKTRFTNQGAIPEVQNAAAPKGPSASDRAYGSLTVTARGLNVRSGPSTNDRVLGMLHRGDKVQELGRNNGWVQIAFGGQTAFVHGHYVSSGGEQARGHAPSPEAQAEAMDLFREANGEQGRGHAPSPEGQAAAMQLFREVNGGPASEKQAAPSQGQAAGKRNLDEIVADLEVGPAAPQTAKAPGQGHAPSAEGQAEAMQLFREVNGGPASSSAAAPTQTAAPTQGHAPSKEKLDELVAELE